MKKILAILLAAALCLCLLAGCGSTASPAATEAPTKEVPAETPEPAEEAVTQIKDFLFPGDKVPNFAVEKTDGSMFILAEELRKYDAVMINIWATWCTPCCVELPVMQEAYEQYSDRIGLVCLSAFDENADIIAFMEENGLDLPMGYDTLGLTDALVYEGYPTTIMIDRFGYYAYYECGSILDPGGFTRMWDYFLSDDYTETQVVDRIPGEKYEGELPDAAELAAAFSPDGSVTFSNDVEDEYAWPFMPAAEGVSNSNAFHVNTEARLLAGVCVNAGDVFTFDYSGDFETLTDQLAVYVDNEPVKTYVCAGEGSYAYRFAEAGDYVLTVAYTQQAPEADTESAGTVVLSNARLVSGDEADAVMAAQPVYPYALEGTDYRLEILNENAKKIELVFPEGTDEELIAYYSVDMYLIPEDTASFRALLGDAYDADTALAYGDADYVYHIASQTENDGEGYLFETELSGIELGGYEDTYVNFIPDVNGADEQVLYYIFKNEENVNYFILNTVLDFDYMPIEGLTWQYEDGTLPTTDAVAELPSQCAYNIYLVDENGEPVDGVMINICTDESCAPAMTSGGFYGFDGQPYPYVIHVLTVPEGYTFDTTQEFVLAEDGDMLIITIPHA